LAGIANGLHGGARLTEQSARCMRRGDQPGPAKVKPFETGDFEDEARGTADAHDGVDGLVWNEDHVRGANRAPTPEEGQYVFRVSVVSSRAQRRS
jgi:hypothetical protein